MDFSNMWQSLILLVVGLAIVYFFLGVMVLTMDLAGKIIPRFAYILPDPVEKKKPAPAASRSASDDAAVALAIAAARTR